MPPSDASNKPASETTPPSPNSNNPTSEKTTSPPSPKQPTSQTTSEKTTSPPSPKQPTSKTTSQTPSSPNPPTRPALWSHFPPPGTPPTTLAATFLAACLAPPFYAGHDAHLLRTLSITSATTTPPSVTCSLLITPTLCNSLGLLHGGATALIFDLVTSMAIAVVRREGWWEGCGVSRTLNVGYIKGVGVGETVVVRGEVVGLGGRLAHLRGEMRRGGEVVATCEHGKVNVDSKAGKGGGAKL